jgi:CRP-like cAMP-binding protein
MSHVQVTCVIYRSGGNDSILFVAQPPRPSESALDAARKSKADRGNLLVSSRLLYRTLQRCGLHGRACKFRAGASIKDSALGAGAACLILSGRACVSELSLPRRPGSTKLLKPGDAVGITETLAGKPGRARLNAVTTCTCLLLTREDLLAALSDDGDLRRDTLYWLAAELKLSLIRSANYPGVTPVTYATR